MPIGVFGKLPAKRDFVAYGIPQEVLGPWETWLQREIAQSRLLLADRWLPAYLGAPMWRFWAGRAVLGRAVAGVLMPSVDGVGRYFPLTLVATAPDGHEIEPPTHGDWPEGFGTLETIALAALDRRSGGHEDVLASLASLSDPPSRARPGDQRLGTDHPAISVSAAFDGAFATLDGWVIDRARDASSVWWTLGGGPVSPMAFACRGEGPAGLPSDMRFAALIAPDLLTPGGVA